MDYEVLYTLLLLPTLFLTIYAQIKVSLTFRKYSKVENERGITGAQAASFLMQKSGIRDIEIKHIKGSLTDNYNPSNKTLNLSTTVYDVPSIAAVGVAAHETGHAIQHDVDYFPLRLRSMFVPIANIGSFAGPYLVLFGILFSFGPLSTIGIFLFSGAVAFYMITLPVEINASHRAIIILREGNLLNEDELKGVKKVLTAAALTYVASALSAILTLLRLLAISNKKRR